MTESVKSNALNFDAGLLLGANYMINERIGLRASYYLGLTDVPSDVFYNTNFKMLKIINLIKILQIY